MKNLLFVLGQPAQPDSSKDRWTLWVGRYVDRTVIFRYDCRFDLF